MQFISLMGAPLESRRRGGSWMSASTIPPVPVLMGAAIKEEPPPETRVITSVAASASSASAAISAAAPRLFSSGTGCPPGTVRILLRGALRPAPACGPSDVLIDTASNNYYALLAGRWFRSAAITGPWTFVPGNTATARPCG